MEAYVNLPAPLDPGQRLLTEIKAPGPDDNLRTTRSYFCGTNRHVTEIYDGLGNNIMDIYGAGDVN